MNRLTTKRIGVLVSALFIFSSVTFSQIDNFDFLRSLPEDGTKYLQAYISPWVNAFGSGLNGGWYNTAKPHKFGGFDITTNFSAGMVPESAGTFDLSKIGLSSSMTGTGTASTISGPDKSGPEITVKDKSTGYTLATFNAAPGTDWKIIPVPSAQVGIGLPFGTEIKGRFIPKIKINDGDISLWGVGLLHSIMQYFPGNKMLPFDVSLFGGYTKLTGNVPIDMQPGIPANYSPSVSFADQNLNINVSALNISAVASLNIPVLTLYGGLGYCKTKTAMEFTGNFPTPTLVTPALPDLPYSEYNNSGVVTGTKFPSMNFEDFSGLRANIGLRIKLAVITIHADYTKAQYNVFSTGLGISFR